MVHSNATEKIKKYKQKNQASISQLRLSHQLSSDEQWSSPPVDNLLIHGASVQFLRNVDTSISELEK